MVLQAVPGSKKNISMRIIGLMLVAIVVMSSTWLTDFDKAKKKAREENKHILIFFSGDDWCYTCRSTRKNILEQDEFSGYADASLVLVSADFPRLNKKSITAAQAKANKELASIYNKEMIIPSFVLVDADGRELKKWAGNQDISADEFVDQIKAAK